MKTHYDIIIVGAGTAGSAMAYTLAYFQNRRILIIDKNMIIPSRIVGELLQPGGVQALAALGLSECATQCDPSVPIYGYAILSGHEKTLLTYPKKPTSFWSYWGVAQHGCRDEKKTTGRAFHNAHFVQALRAKMETLPNVTFVQGSVTTLVYQGNTSRIIGVGYKQSHDGSLQVVHAPLTIIADGMWSALRKTVISLNSNVKPKTISHFVGLLLRHEKESSPLPHPHHGHVILAKPSPILMYQISSTETRALVDIMGKMPNNSCSNKKENALEQHLCNHVLPQIPICLQKAFAVAVAEGPIQSMPNRSLPGAETMSKHGVLLLGDAYNMRHPLTGAGMSVALQDVVLLKTLLSTQDNLWHLNTLALHAQFQQARQGHATTLNVLANALYAVMTTPEACHERTILQKACFDYLKNGGICSRGPIGLLSGMVPKPFVLTGHFCAVALLGMYYALLPFPSPTRVLQCLRMLKLACTILLPLLREEGFFSATTLLTAMVL